MLVEQLEDRCLLSAEFGLAFGLGGGGFDMGTSITTNDDGNIYVATDFNGTVDFDPDAGMVHNIASGSSSGGAIAKYSPDGDLLWAEGFGTAGGFLSTREVSVDASGNVYLTGAFTQTVDFDRGTTYTDNRDILTSNGTLYGRDNAFTLKLNSQGEFQWVRHFSGNRITGEGVQVGSDGSVYVGGWWWGTADFDPTGSPGGDVVSSWGSQDAFVTKLSAGGDFVWARGIGAGYQDSGNALAIDGNNNLFLTGFFRSTVDFDRTAASPGDVLSSNGSSDSFVLKLDSDGDFQWVRGWGNSVHDFNIRDTGNGVTTDAAGNVYTTGTLDGGSGGPSISIRRL